MNAQPRTLKLQLCGTGIERKKFLKDIRNQVMELTGEMMTLDALIHEIAKNIYDHAGGTGELTIEEIEPDVFSFSIRDCGTITYEFEKCIGRSTKAGNGVNCGVGLRIIRDHAAFLDIDLKIDTSKGFSYSGTYKKKFA